MQLNRWMAVALLALLAGCRHTQDEDGVSGPVPPPAAEITAITENMPLDQKLALMQADLDDALRQNLKGTAPTRIYHAEAISDRLLEAPPPFTWLRGAYSTETRLRQIQALADRCVAEVRRQEAEPVVRADVRDLQQEIVRLRAELAAGGGARPASLDSLLAGVTSDSTAAGDAASLGD
jgi:hypothetical protein